MLKSIKIVILSACLLVGIIGLDNALAAPLAQTEPRLFPYSADGLAYGHVDETGAWVIEPQFDFAADFAEGLAVVEQAGQFGYIDPSGQVVVEPQFEFAADFAFGLAPVVVDGRFGYIDQTGQTVIEPQFSGARAFTAEGLALVRPDQSFGYIDQSGQFAIEPQFETASNFSDGLAAVTVDGQYGYIDDSGQVVIEPQFDFAASFAEGLAAVLVDDQVGFIDQSGQIVIAPAYDFAQNFSEGLAAVRVDGLTGFIDPAGQMVIEPRFDSAEDFSEGLAAVREEELVGFIDPSGQMVIVPQFEEAGPFQAGLARVEWTSQWGAIDQNGTPSFQLPVSAVSPAATQIIPFIPGVPAETRDGICLKQPVSPAEPTGWRCIVEAEGPDDFARSFACLLADDGQSLVCAFDPVVGNPGFRVNLVEPVPGLDNLLRAGATGSQLAWQVQLADGTICRLRQGVSATVNGQRADYACSDGSILLGQLQPGPVWQADRVALTDISQTDEGYVAGQISPVAVAVVWQPADPAMVLAEIGLSAAELSIDATGIAEAISPQLRPAVPFTGDTSTGLAGEPAHLRFAFDNEDLPEGGGIFPDQVQLLIYPVAAYREAGVDEAGQRIEALQALLQDRPDSVEGELPVLPGFGEAEQTLQAQLRYLDFGGGSGVRFITHYGVGAAPITDHGTFYTFQGLTDDGQYVIVFFHPVPTELLPGGFEEVAALIRDRQAFAENYETYRQETRDRLEQASPGDFRPDLTDLDAMLESIQLRPGAEAEAESESQAEAKQVWVDSVEVQTVNGEYVATISGNYPDSCSTLGDVVTTVGGDTIMVTVFAESPPDMMCATVLVPFEETITLDVGELEPGEYTVVVNETATTTLTVN